MKNKKHLVIYLKNKCYLIVNKNQKYKKIELTCSLYRTILGVIKISNYKILSGKRGF